MALHRTLARQIRKSFGDEERVPNSLEFHGFLDVISRTYEGFDEDRRLLERSLGISSKELMESEQLYRTVFENAPIGIYSVNSEGVIDYVNPKFLEISGASSQDVVGIDAFNLPTYVASGLSDYIKKAFQGKSFEDVIDYTSYVGHKRSYRHYRGVPIYSHDDSKKVERVLLMVEDVTQRIIAEEKMKQFASFADVNPHPVLRLTCDLQIQLSNPAAASYFKDGNLLGKDWAKICPGINKDRLLTELQKNGQYLHEIKLGEAYLELLHKNLAIYSAIHIYGFDVTRRKLAEQKLQKRTNEYERMNKLMVGRELRMVELKKEIRKLKESALLNHSKTRDK